MSQPENQHPPGTELWLRDLYRLYYRRVVTFFLRSGFADPEDLAQEVFLRVFEGADSFQGQSSIHTWIYRIAANVRANELRKMAALKRGGGGNECSLDALHEQDRELLSATAYEAVDPLTRIIAREQLQEIVARFESMPKLTRAAFLVRLEKEIDLKRRDGPAPIPVSVPAAGQSCQHLRRWSAAAVEAMPLRMRRVFLLRYRDGYKYKDIALELNISIQTVKAHLHQARERLQRRRKSLATLEPNPSPRWDAAVETLPQRMQRAFLLRQDGHKYSQIAELMNISVSTVKAHLYQARARLKNLLPT